MRREFSELHLLGLDNITEKCFSYRMLALKKNISVPTHTNNYFLTIAWFTSHLLLIAVAKMKGFFLSLLVKTSSYMNMFKSSNSKVTGQYKMLVDLHCSSRGRYWLSPCTFQHCLSPIISQVKFLQLQQLVLLLIFWSQIFSLLSVSW